MMPSHIQYSMATLLLKSPHVLITDDFYDWAGHFLTIHIDSLQQWLQPAYVTLDVGVKEGKNLAYEESKHPVVKQIPKSAY